MVPGTDITETDTTYGKIANYKALSALGRTEGDSKEVRCKLCPCEQGIVGQIGGCYSVAGSGTACGSIRKYYAPGRQSLQIVVATGAG